MTVSHLTDANFSAERLHDIYSAELVNSMGNCASRVTAMVAKYFDGTLPTELGADGHRVAATASSLDWPARCAQAAAEATASYEEMSLSSAARTAVRLVSEVDAFIQVTEPFRLAKQPERRAELGAILYQCMEALRIAGELLYPIMPSKMGELSAALGQAGAAGAMKERLRWGGMQPGVRLEKLALFPRVEVFPPA